MSRVIKGAVLGPALRAGNGTSSPVVPQSGQALLAEALAQAEQLKAIAEAELAAAQAQATALINEAEAAAQALLREAEALAEEVRQQAQQEGFAAGKAEAKAQLAAELASQQAELEAAAEARLNAIEAERHTYIRDLQAPLLQLVIAAAEQVIRGELATRPEQVATLVAAGLGQLVGETEPRLRICPTTRPTLAESQGLLLSQLPEAAQLHLEEDPSLEPGEFIAIGEAGLVDGRFRAQLLAIEEALAPFLAPDE